MRRDSGPGIRDSPGASRNSYLAIAAAALLGLAVRLAYLSQLEGSPPFAGLMGDSRQYDAWAQRIAAGEWLGTEVFYQAPLYPYTLAVIYTIGGRDPDLVRLVQAILGAASVVLIGVAARRFFSDRVGAIAAILLAVYPPAFFFDGLIQKSSLDLLLVTLVLALIGEFGARRGWRWLVALGITTSVFVLNRENARVLFPVMAAWLMFGFRDVPVRRRLAWRAVFAAAALAVLLPVGFRNYRVGGEFLVSTSQLGPNFYIGNNPDASGSYEPLVPERGDALHERDDATRLASEAAGRALSPGEVSDYWLNRSLAYIRSQPVHWLRLMGRKLLLSVNAAELPDTESLAVYADYSPLLRALGWLNLGVMLPLAAFGAWAYRAEWRRLLVLYGIFSAFLVSVAIFYVVERYRHPMVPLVLMFSAAGVSGLWEAWADRTRATARQVKSGRARKAPSHPPPSPEPSTRRWLPGVALAVLVALVVHVPFDGVWDQTYLNLGSLLALNGRPAEAVPLLRKAAALEPEYAEPYFRLGLALRDAGDPQAATDALATAARLRPEHADTHAALAVLLQEMGKPGEALPHFNEAVRLAPGSVEARTNLGMALASAGRFEPAVEQFREAVRLKPDAYERRINLAQALCAAGREAECVEQYEAAARLAPDPAVAKQITDALRQKR